ncbi:response regulator [Oculatella sp. LEGE 06141]|uniref:response regulator n=1 Tax=Oculatella sp. LEGE 06141 TaxID=1828648 RepID=UPI00187F34A0|nr:response regulator [Oculatella sp. LEGE 06141]MBE9181888.1 response regulator [Oculatella sp. LEGE 06141]
MQFLVVDDSAVDRHFLSSLLERLGHQVEAYESTAGILEKLATGNYSSVFLDIVMPDKDGYKFLREVRSNNRTANQHVVLYSSKKTTVEINYGLKRTGANDYLAKPLTRERLEQVLQKI